MKNVKRVIIFNEIGSDGNIHIIEVFWGDETHPKSAHIVFG
jgi:hypothetical protein